MKQNKVSTLTGHLVVGAAVCMSLILVCAAVAAAMISAGKLPETATGYIAMITLFLAAFGGAVAGTRKVREKKLYTSLMIAAVCFLILAAMTAIFFGGRYQGAGVTALVLISAAFTAAMLGQGKGSRGNLRRSKIKRR